ncbi:hypothetical protein TTHERM_000683402 (macronuclear) [Tetrahymena thermophila SB210]|uniref:Uncharacterized protein n=1 Tax=Tetrahymena thermophila (strain SB210) TaxID=312017 RepID=W7XE32_TETTS|nr:hypothetical protein TTHERM_000683402 [Tetrahymena thermophila SB210]EWS71119.1 hypothetical protein TTHERM_000683402 [Tetrahymena thermophila SB210]|eukprot:XP_012656362.1 hypothetical protein TTHERM_000683402 [Tetrahymena thermophila SB210]
MQMQMQIKAFQVVRNRMIQKFLNMEFHLLCLIKEDRILVNNINQLLLLKYQEKIIQQCKQMRNNKSTNNYMKQTNQRMFILLTQKDAYIANLTKFLEFIIAEFVDTVFLGEIITVCGQEIVQAQKTISFFYYSQYMLQQPCFRQLFQLQLIFLNQELIS